MINEMPDTQNIGHTRLSSERFAIRRMGHGLVRRNFRRPLQVMKFGGTSVGDASCIARVVKIIETASRESNVAVVVSAMGGVTNQLIEAANQSKAGTESRVAEIFAQLRKRHNEVVEALIHSTPERKRLQSKLDNLFSEGERLCQGAMLRRELTPRTLDAISGLGERMCTPIVAAALSEAGVASEALEATELVVTDSSHGGAEPLFDLTRTRCQARVAPLFEAGIVPVMTGFIGATEEGVLTTLGRGGSDYSATILGAAFNADEITIWTDVDGILTADPHLVPEATTIPEISYHKAAELAYFGAKVLHPKTLRPVVQRGIPVWIRNSFAPGKTGTKISAEAHPADGGVWAVTATREAALITLTGPALDAVPDPVGRALAAAAAVRAHVLMICHSPSCNRICLVVGAAFAQLSVDALRSEFGADLKDESHAVAVDLTVAVITLVGPDPHAMRGIAREILNRLDRENVNIIATGQCPAERNVSIVVARDDIMSASVTSHREFLNKNPEVVSAPTAIPSSRFAAQ